MNSTFCGYVLLPVRRDLSCNQWLYSPIVSQNAPHCSAPTPIKLTDGSPNECVHRWLETNQFSPSIPLMYIQCGKVGWMSEFGTQWHEDAEASSQLLSLLCSLFVFGFDKRRS